MIRVQTVQGKSLVIDPKHVTMAAEGEMNPISILSGNMGGVGIVLVYMTNGEPLRLLDPHRTLVKQIEEGKKT